MWVKGQPWRVVNSLQKLNEQIRAYAPRAVPPATDVNAWGSLADDAHSSSSDHYPHFFAALGTTAVVCARDFPHAPALGLDGGVVTEALRISRDSRIGYLIFNRQITGPNHGWHWEDYDGSDPHDTHFHVSSVHTAAADSTAAWTLPGAAAAASTNGEKMLTRMVIQGNAAQFLGIPYLYSSWIPDGAAIAQLSSMTSGAWMEDVAHSFGVATVPRAALGRIIGPCPPEFADLQWPPAAQPATVDAAALAAALAPLLPAEVDEAHLLNVLQSAEGQAALARAANTAEDS